jgi:hypothetical protein
VLLRLPSSRRPAAGRWTAAPFRGTSVRPTRVPRRGRSRWDRTTADRHGGDGGGAQEHGVKRDIACVDSQYEMTMNSVSSPSSHRSLDSRDAFHQLRDLQLLVDELTAHILRARVTEPSRHSRAAVRHVTRCCISGSHTRCAAARSRIVRAEAAVRRRQSASTRSCRLSARSVSNCCHSPVLVVARRLMSSTTLRRSRTSNSTRRSVSPAASAERFLDR